MAHTALVNNIEIADVIFWDEDSIYLMHNKDKFSGQGARDVVNQVLTSSEYLHQALSSSDAQGFLERYYDTIKSRYEGKDVPFKKEQFIEMVASSDSFQSLVKYVMEHPVVVKDHKDKEQITEEYEKLIRDYYRIMSAENIDERKQ